MVRRAALGLGRLGALAALGLVAAQSSAVAQGSVAAQSPLAHTITITLSSIRAAARPVAATAVLGYEMQCGYPGPGPVVLELPAAEHVPASIRRSSVLVDGKAATSVRVSGHAVSVGLAPPPQIMCDVIGPGRLTIELTRAAGLGNPTRPGSYVLRVARGSTSFSARLTIRSS
jgi:hypothetical protein